MPPPVVTFPQLHQDLKARVPQTTVHDLAQARAGASPPVVLDVRELEELPAGMVPGAVHIPRGFLELRVEDALTDREAPVVVYCAGGTRSLFAADTLQRMGYRRVASLAGGFTAWAQAGQPVETPRLLTDAERRRYSRHLLIPEVGEAGQVKLLAAKVLLIGAGGLGCPAALYLAAAGVGTLGVVDDDVVDESNLQRQILHPTDRVGASKVESARRTLLAQNPGIKVVAHEERLTSANVERLLADYDLVVDGSDNFPTRYLINDACVKQRKPCVHGSIYRFEGQVTVFDPARGGPCYRCLYREPPPAEFAPSCADAGVLGVLPGVVGVLEAVEAIKLILGVGEPLTGRLLTYDALATRFRELKLRRDPACVYCASLDGAPFPGFVDYEFFCAKSDV
jgi:molybdopterin/thiamine biosynthesis adenylyltransferase/rhodanese-related sulfurtransferase